MKYFSLLLIFVACSSSINKKEVQVSTPTIEMGQRAFLCDSALNVRDMQLVSARDSIKKLLHKNDSLKANLFLESFKVEKVKYYLSICKKNPTNNKYLKGWVIRAVN